LRDFDSIYQELQPKIQRYLCNLTNEEEALDLTQTVFLKVSRSLGSFRGESSVATWVYRIATNAAQDHAASAQAKQKRLEEIFDAADALDALPDTRSPGTDREFIRKEMNACIRSVIDQLPETYRAVLLLSDFEELSNQEIAETLNVSLETVKIRLHRARAALKSSMECECSFYHDERNELACDRKKG